VWGKISVFTVALLPLIISHGRTRVTNSAPIPFASSRSRQACGRCDSCCRAHPDAASRRRVELACECRIDRPVHVLLACVDWLDRSTGSSRGETWEGRSPTTGTSSSEC